MFGQKKETTSNGILICDDASFMRSIMKDLLIENGYEVAGEAENGVVAVEKYKELRPALVLMDITMPEMDGIEALKRIKVFDPNANIIMVAAMGQREMVIESLDAGAIDFIVKPIKAENFIESIKNVIG